MSAVTVYQGQALVTRELEVPQAQGLLEVVVTNLPENVLPGSLFAEPADGVQIRSVRYRARPIEEDVRKEVRELDQQIQDVQDKFAAVAEGASRAQPAERPISRNSNNSPPPPRSRNSRAACSTPRRSRT